MTFKPNQDKAGPPLKKRPVAPSYVGPAEHRPKQAATPRPPRDGAPRPFRSNTDRPPMRDGAATPRPPRDGAPRPFRNNTDRPPMRDGDAPRPPRDGAPRPFRSNTDRPPMRDGNAPRPPRDGAPRPFRNNTDRPPMRDGAAPRPPRDGAPRPFRSNTDRPPMRDGDAPRPPRDGAPRPFRSNADRPPMRDGAAPRPPRDGAPRPFRSNTDRPPMRDGAAPRSPRDGAPRPFRSNTDRPPMRDGAAPNTGLNRPRLDPSRRPDQSRRPEQSRRPARDQRQERHMETILQEDAPFLNATPQPIGFIETMIEMQETPPAIDTTTIKLSTIAEPIAVLTAKPRRKSASEQVIVQPVMVPKSPLKVIPLGGLREIGKNLTIYEYDQDMIIVDCGLAFPEEDMPGIDVVIPDFSYIIRNKSKLRGVFLTHGHEDHIGALPWLCKEINVPIYGNSLTIALTRIKLNDRGTGVSGVVLNSVKDGDHVSAGVFDVEFIHTNHSIADANAFAIRTPVGIVFHSGDFKVDYTPINGLPINLSRIAALGAEGVLLMMCESTNVEKKGYSPSESKVGESFADIFAKAAGRIIVATFSSNVFRLQQIISAAENQNRKVALVGRSMLNVFGAANELGYIQMRSGTLIDIDQVDRYSANELVLISTGSQGEPMSALTRMAFSEHKRVDIIPGDTVVISASPIPGNEKPIYRVINELFKRGAHVIYESLSEIHVSGHAYQEELKLLHSLVRPRFFIPGHGEYRHLYRHAELAHQLGQAWQNIFIIGNGDILEILEDSAKVVGFTNAAGVLIDGSSIGEIDNLVLRDRKLLAEDGLVAIFIALDKETGALIGQPDVQARGFIYESETDQIIDECRRKINNFALRAQNDSKPLAAMIRSGGLRDQLRDLLFDRTKRRPIILVSVMEV